MKNLTILILVAGKSSRFKSKKSKIFHELAGLPIINHIYNTAKKISNDNIIFICNKDNINFLKVKFPNSKCIIQKNQKGTADAVLSAKNIINKNSDILILFGDAPLITYKSLNNLCKNYFKNRSLGSMLAFNSLNPYGYGRVIIANKKVISVIEELNASKEIKKISLCNSGIMICKFKLLFSFIGKIDNKNKKKEKYLPDIFNICHKNKKSFNYILCNEEEMLGINTLNDFNKVDEIFQNHLRAKLLNNGVKILEPKTVRLSYDTKIGKNSLIEPYTFFQNGVKIEEDVHIKSHTTIESAEIKKGSSIGPFARIRPYSKIGKNVKIGNYVEVKNSTIGDKTSISHLTYIGDSKIGKKVNIGAGTITCNYDGFKKNKTIIEDNAFIGSNTSLIAPIKIKKNSKIGAGSVISTDIPENSLALERAKLKIVKKYSKK
tara:strand:- start:759 stop:2060 length:1302 start_codon:yes stop_codon:yes gene_type:complete